MPWWNLPETIRAAAYGLSQTDSKREQAKDASGSLKEFLKSLNLSIKISAPNQAHFPRIAQLTQRTNQFNTTTIRRQESDIARLIKTNLIKAAIVEVSDRYGDYGLVGVLLYNVVQDAVQVDSLILSCRALGRGVEQTMAKFLAEEAVKHNAQKVNIAFSHTERNEPVRAFLETVATYENTQVSKGTIYQYNTADLLQLIPLEAATPSLAVNGNNADPSPGASSRASSLKTNKNEQRRGHLWHAIASALRTPLEIKEKVQVSAL